MSSVIPGSTIVEPATDTAKAVVEPESTEELVHSFLPDRVYDVLKWVAMVLLYAVATFVGAVGPAWGWPDVNAIVLTLTSLGTLLGAVLGVSSVLAK